MIVFLTLKFEVHTVLFVLRFILRVEREGNNIFVANTFLEVFFNKLKEQFLMLLKEAIFICYFNLL